MASITTRPNGSRFITFLDGSGQAKHITLGKIDRRYAEALKVKVEDLVSASIHGHAPTDETCRWLAGRDERLYTKLSDAGLVPRRETATLSEVLDRYIEDREGELKPESIRKLNQTRTKLLEYFDPSTPVRKITEQDAALWRRSLKDQGLSEAVVKTHSGNAKTMVADAVKRKAIPENPFAGLKSGSTPSKYSRYITPEEIQSVIKACPNPEWRLLFGLARYAGLRVPSETHLLTWSDVDFERCRLRVRSPKTERYEGHDERLVPIDPRLMALLQDRFTWCPEGEARLVTINGKGAFVRPVRKIWAKANVKPWERLWQTLRSSCEKEWAMTHPQYAVSKWIGHSITVSGRHYANDVPDELFDRAAGLARGAQRQAQ